MTDDEEPPKRPLATVTSPYPVSRLAPKFDLVDVAAEIARADATIAMVASAKLEVIRGQVQALQEEARAILEEANLAAGLHRARCNFRKVPGHVYHLYVRPDGERYFSMLAPDEWGSAPPHAFAGSYRLEADHGFTRV